MVNYVFIQKNVKYVNDFIPATTVAIPFNSKNFARYKNTLVHFI